jgi:hypothetical protein
MRKTIIDFEGDSLRNHNTDFTIIVTVVFTIFFVLMYPIYIKFASFGNSVLLYVVIYFILFWMFYHYVRKVNRTMIYIQKIEVDSSNIYIEYQVDNQIKKIISPLSNVLFSYVSVGQGSRILQVKMDTGNDFIILHQYSIMNWSRTKFRKIINDFNSGFSDNNNSEA